MARRVYTEMWEFTCNFPTTNVAVSLPNGFQLVCQEDSSVRQGLNMARNFKQLARQMSTSDRLELIQCLMEEEGIGQKSMR